MTKRIYRSIVLVALAVLLTTMTVVVGLLYTHFSTSQRSQLKTETALAAQGVTLQGEAFFENLQLDECRITWVDAQGNVLYDNRWDAAVMENHLQRQEIIAAMETGYGESFRYSDTLMERTLYAAQKLPDGTVIRLSVSYDSALTLILNALQPVLVVSIVVLVLALILANRLAKKIVKPLNQLNLDAPLSNRDYEEISPLLYRIDSQQRQLRMQEAALQRKQDEFDTVTSNMSEGLVLLNNKGQILSINNAASQLLDINRTLSGQDILTLNRQLEIQTLLLDALSGKRGEKTVALARGEYQIDASPVFSDGLLSGVVLLLFDVTEKHKAEMLRREFTANVSHELKTPLQSICGYAELLASGIVRAADVGQFSQKIYTEAQRMTQLVADILHLSRLDEGAGDMPREPIDLKHLAAEVLTTLEPQAAQAAVTLTLEGQDVRINGVRQLISGIVRNLCDNAIKYNRKGGSVFVKIADCGENACITVRDTGIGIPTAHQERIFERFYRVDKSHSKNVGGTGLGLSIVKHAVLVSGGTIVLDSTPGQGTAITVTLPK